MFLCSLMCFTILLSQDKDTSITLSHFMYPEIEGIPIILDEYGENSFFMDTYFPNILNDFQINNVMVDGALHLPQGSYIMPVLLPNGMVTDSINHYSQINYRKGDYNSGELGISLQIEQVDSSFFSFQGFKQSPPVIYSPISWNDNLQNYIMSYEHKYENESIAIDVMYHLEDYHLPLSFAPDSNFKREVESFHSGLSFEKKWHNLYFKYSPAFQLTDLNRQGT